MMSLLVLLSLLHSLEQLLLHLSAVTILLSLIWGLCCSLLLTRQRIKVFLLYQSIRAVHYTWYCNTIMILIVEVCGLADISANDMLMSVIGTANPASSDTSTEYSACKIN